MKIRKSKIVFFMLLCSSSIYFALAYIGYKKVNVELEDAEYVTGEVVDSGIAYRESGKYSAKVCYFKLNNLNQILGIYKANKEYESILSNLTLRSSIAIYYKPSTIEEINIDVYQIEKDDIIIYSHDEYRNKESSLIFIGLIAGFGTVAASIWYWKKIVNAS